MRNLYTSCRSAVLRWSLLLPLLLTARQPLRAQESCLLVPVPLTERVAGAALVVEASVGAQETVAAGGHLYTLSDLTVYKVFRGAVPGRLQLAEAGGTLGLRREVLSPGVAFAPGQQGLFLLMPDPVLPGAYRLVAGPQGFVQYDLTDRSAAEPFGRYASIAGKLYPAVEAATGQPRRMVQANAALLAPVVAARPQAAPVISSFSPSQLSAGRDAVLTIDGSNFGTTQGSGRVDFPNADNGGGSFVSANPVDYLAWSDTQIQVRVPSRILATGGVAGTGNFRVVNGTSETGTSPSALTVRYALSNVSNNGVINRPRLINEDGAGGYTLQYSPSFTAVAGAPASFERALATWACASRLRRVVNAVAAPEATTGDGVNAVRFGTLSAGVLGVANSYYSGCFVGGVAQFELVETDYTFAPTPSAGTTWQYGPAAPSSSQYDFESVAVHELGHGTQLTHIIDVTAVMHFSITNGQAKRSLSTASDIAGAQDVFSYSLSNPCGTPAPVAMAVPAGCSTALPVELVSFDARYDAGRGTVLHWATASEKNSAYFAVETHGADAANWLELLRQPAAGTSTRRREYAAADPRPLAGTRYYRLRQVDLDGTVAYSPVVAVAGHDAGATFYPNPTTGRLHLSGPARAGRLRVLDLAGREVARFALVPGPAEIDLTALRPGLYQMEWTDGATTRRERLQKQ
jgi:hypothetical protein